MLVGCHALIGADAVSGFYRKSKKTVFQKIQANSESRHLLYHIGGKKHLSEKDIADITKSMTKFTYNYKQSSTLVQARANKWKVMKTKTALGLTRDEDSFRQHLLWASYQAKIWCDFESASAPEDPQHNEFDCVTFNGKYLLPACNVLQNLNTDESNSDSESDSDESDNSDNT